MMAEPSKGPMMIVDAIFCDANAMESGVFTVKSVRIFSDLNMNISLLNDPHNEIRLYNLLNYM